MDDKLSIGKVILKIIGSGISALLLLFALYVIYQGGEYAYDFGYRVFTETAVDTVEEAEDKVVQITGDMGAIEIGNLLEKKD